MIETVKHRPSVAEKARINPRSGVFAWFARSRPTKPGETYGVPDRATPPGSRSPRSCSCSSSGGR